MVVPKEVHEDIYIAVHNIYRCVDPESAKFVTLKAVIAVLIREGAAWAQAHPEEAMKATIGLKMAIGRPAGVASHRVAYGVPKNSRGEMIVTPPPKPQEATLGEIAEKERLRKEFEERRTRAEEARAWAKERGVNLQD